MTGPIEGLGRMAGETVMLLAADRRRAVGLTGLLRRRGFGVLTPRDAAEALTLARAVRPSVALVDLRCPGMAFVLERLARDERCGRPSLVLLVPPGVTPVPSLLAGGDVEVVPWEAGDLDGTVTRVVAIADQQRDLRASSPLTGLPGNAAIRAELERRVAAGCPLALLYVDLDAFKPYNDHHGFLRGDDVLRALAGLLLAEARRHDDAFVGHVGGDDFVVVLPPAEAEGAARRVVETFDALAGHFYTPSEAARGWIAGRDRLGRRCRWPLLSLSVGIARSDRRPVGSALELVDLATEMKRVAKRVRGSAVAVDQRGRQDAGMSWRARALATAAAAPLRRAAAVVATLAVAAVLFVPAGTALALAKPGEFLWPAARLLEDARLALVDTERAVGLRLELAGERLADAVAALSVGEDDRASAALGEYRRRSDEAVALLAALDPPARAGSLARVRSAHERQASMLASMVEARCDVADGGPRPCAALRDALAAVGSAGPDETAGPGGRPALGAPGAAGGPGAPADGRQGSQDGDVPTAPHREPGPGPDDDGPDVDGPDGRTGGSPPPGGTGAPGGIGEPGGTGAPGGEGQPGGEGPGAGAPPEPAPGAATDVTGPGEGAPGDAGETPPVPGPGHHDTPHPAPGDDARPPAGAVEQPPATPEDPRASAGPEDGEAAGRATPGAAGSPGSSSPSPSPSRGSPGAGGRGPEPPLGAPPDRPRTAVDGWGDARGPRTPAAGPEAPRATPDPRAGGDGR